jgi:hypothetical protein
MRISSKTTAAAILLLAAALSSLSALQIDRGRVRLVLHEGLGRFSLYTRPTAAPADFVPLFVDQDPRTSGISLVVNDRIYKLGESSEFSEKVTPSTDAAMARFEWSSRTLEVVQEFVPVSTSPSGDAEGVRMSIRIENRARNRLSVGLRLCLDTYLGEDNLSHFTSDRHQEIRSELTVPETEMVRYWLSPSASAPQRIGLLCITAGEEVTSPDKIVFANWKRLSEASWNYETSSQRNFNLMPYSINDSAVCMYYEPVELPAQGSREIVLILGNVTLSDYEQGVKVARAETPAAAAPAAPKPGEPPIDSLQMLLDRLSSEPGSTDQNLNDLNRLIEQIDRLLASGEPISDDEVRLMEEILSAIKDRSERYPGGR